MKEEALYQIYKDGKPYDSAHQNIKGAYLTPGYARAMINREAEYIAAEQHGGKFEYWKLERAKRKRIEDKIRADFDVVRYVPEHKAANAVVEWLNRYVDEYEFMPPALAEGLLTAAGVADVRAELLKIYPGLEPKKGAK